MIPRDDFLIKRQIEKALFTANDINQQSLESQENSNPNLEKKEKTSLNNEEDDFEISELTVSSPNN